MEHHPVHNCFVVLAEMAGIETEASMGTGPSSEGHTNVGRHGAMPGEPPGLGTRIPFNFMPPTQREGGMPPIMFGTFIQPSQDIRVLGSSGVQPESGDPPASMPSSLLSTFNMGQSLLFRMGPPMPASSSTSVTGSNRRSAGLSSSSEGQNPRQRPRMQHPPTHPLRTLSQRLERGSLGFQRPPDALGESQPPRSGPLGSSRQVARDLPSSASALPSGEQPTDASASAREGGSEGSRRSESGPGVGSMPYPLDQLLQRAFSHISAEAFITDFVRHAIEANRYRGNPPASQFGIDHLKVETAAEGCSEACTVCQDTVEEGAVTLSMPCGHFFHKDCLMPWLLEHNTCPVCRCEIESHCPRYNQQNFEKLKGELGTETISRHKNGDPSSEEEQPRIVHSMGAWQSGPEPALMTGAAGTRSLRMTLRMPAGALATFVDRLSSGSPRNIEQSAQPSPSDSAAAAPASNATQDRPFLHTRISRPSVSRFAPRTSNLSLSETRGGPAAPGPASLAEHAALLPSLTSVPTYLQQQASGAPAVSRAGDGAGAAAGAGAEAGAGASAHAELEASDRGHALNETSSVRQCAWASHRPPKSSRCRRRTHDEANDNCAAPALSTGHSPEATTSPVTTSPSSGRTRGSAKRQRTGAAGTESHDGVLNVAQVGDARDSQQSPAGASCPPTPVSSGLDAPVSSRTRKRH